MEFKRGQILLMVYGEIKIRHFYHDIFGWFDFEEIYKNMVDLSPYKAHFVEVGCYRGKSAAFMGVEIFNSGKKIRLDCIDFFTPQENIEGVPSITEVYENLSPLYEIVDYRLIQGSSVDASKSYPDKSLDFVFIDANHEYESILADINHWTPKVKEGGVIAGHDFVHYYPGVIKAVKESFDNFDVIKKSWLAHV